MNPLLPDSQKLRNEMVDDQLVRRGITDKAVLDAMRAVPREYFVTATHLSDAYDDRALPIASGQTISQPYVVALTLEAAKIEPGHTALEIGTGSGYVAALLSRLAAKVFTVEYHEPLANAAWERLAQLDCSNVEIRACDGNFGWPEAAPFDAILAAAAAPKMPQAWKDQLALGGRIVAPVGRMRQRLICLTRTDGGEFREEYLCDVRYVPLLGGSEASRSANP